MSRIKKGPAISTSVLGVFAFGFGLGASIHSWNLESTTQSYSIEITDDHDVLEDNDLLNLKFVALWWGGIFVRF